MSYSSRAQPQQQQHRSIWPCVCPLLCLAALSLPGRARLMHYGKPNQEKEKEKKANALYYIYKYKFREREKGIQMFNASPGLLLLLLRQVLTHSHCGRLLRY